MRNWSCFVTIWLALCWCPFVLAESANNALPVVAANDNRTPAGELSNGVLKLELELREGRWYPENDGGPYRDVYAFAEKNHAPQSSGPLIRVPQGTRIHATLRNTLPMAAKIYGLHRHPGDPKEALRLAPGETRELEFLAGEPGTYLYWATTSDKSLATRIGPDSWLSGAFVVDPPGTKVDDRIFVIGLTSDPETFQQLAAINGKSWPYTEHFTFTVGETVHWRVINPSFDPHSMHLHGFYFTVEGFGDGEHYERYPRERQRRVVTERIDTGQAFEMSWVPERAGNWLFHCHMLIHMSVPELLHPSTLAIKEAPAVAHSEPDQSLGMGGLVIGIKVLPRVGSAPAVVAAKAAHKLQLVISENRDKIPLYRLEVNDPRVAVQADKNADKSSEPSLLGPPIVLTRGEETEIEVKNLTTNPTAIHWHGIELESYYDGVPGWTGSGQQTTPAIAPGTSFVAHMAPPRAGTFIYHTHWHDRMQLVNGVYGPLIVLEPGQKYDPEHDKTFVFSTGRYAPFGEIMLVNGSPEPAPVELKTGTRYRLRFINITTNESDLRVRLVSQEVPVQWKVVAQDGADLPEAQQVLSSADLPVTVGETDDVEYQSDREGYAEIHFSLRTFEALVMQPVNVVATK